MIKCHKILIVFPAKILIVFPAKILIVFPAKILIVFPAKILIVFPAKILIVFPAKTIKARGYSDSREVETWEVISDVSTCRQSVPRWDVPG